MHRTHPLSLLRNPLESSDFDREWLPLRFGSDGVAARVVGGVFVFEGRPLPPILSSLPTGVDIPNDGDRAPDRLALMTQFMMAEARQPRPGAALMISRIIDLFVIRTLRSWAEHHPPDAGWPGGARQEKLRRALHAMHAEPHRPWTVDGLSSLAGMSRSAFAERFCAAVGDPPLHYLA